MLKARFQRRNVNVLATAVSIAAADLNSGFFGGPRTPLSHVASKGELDILSEGR